MADAGYSGTPLAAKLGLKDGQWAAFIALPESLSDLAMARDFRHLETVADWHLPDGARDVIHLFTTKAAEVDAALPILRDRIGADGMIWVSWPKKASRVVTDVTEDVIRDRALADVLVDVKVYAVDDIWSGLKLMVRRAARPAHIHAGMR